ncbi:glycosyl hydrolase family 18 protein [Streptomyces sp. T-3]|nr:glycosyl hydrolase family 18 protein [Streptomyces sp. T-3]
MATIRSTLRALAVFATAGLTLTALPAAQAADPREEAPAPRTVSAWLPYWDQEGGYRTALRHKDQLHTVSPFWYQAKTATDVSGHKGAGDRRIIDGLHRAGIKVVPTVTDPMKAGVLAGIVTTPARRAQHVRALTALARSRAYDGIDIDYESIFESATGTDAATLRRLRAGYATFVEELCGALHAQRRQCVITVTPQTAGNGRMWDYRRIGAAADRLRIMAYNLHWSMGPAGPLSSPAWYEEILANATKLVPKQKIELALPAYGWDWAVGGKSRARHVTSKEAEALRRKVKAPYRLDPVSRTPHFTYREGKVRRTVWYQDACGTAAHLPVLRKYGVANTALWALNFEDPQLWRTLARR